MTCRSATGSQVPPTKARLPLPREGRIMAHKLT